LKLAIAMSSSKAAATAPVPPAPTSNPFISQWKKLGTLDPRYKSDIFDEDVALERLGIINQVDVINIYDLQDLNINPILELKNDFLSSEGYRYLSPEERKSAFESRRVFAESVLEKLRNSTSQCQLLLYVEKYGLQHNRYFNHHLCAALGTAYDFSPELWLAHVGDDIFEHLPSQREVLSIRSPREKFTAQVCKRRDDSNRHLSKFIFKLEFELYS
jgi:hypothetical protein